MAAAIWAWDLLFLDVVHHLLVCPACNVSAVEIFDKVVRSVTCLTVLAVHKRVRESADVT